MISHKKTALEWCSNAEYFDMFNTFIASSYATLEEDAAWMELLNFGSALVSAQNAARYISV